MATKTTYTDKAGNKKIGYIRDGATYTDEGLTTRVPEGSVVATNGGTYYKGKGSGAKITPATAEDDSFTAGGREYKTHYNDKGEAYVDAENTTRVPSGTTLRRDGVQYYHDNTLGTVPTVSGGKTLYDRSMKDIGGYLNDALAAERKAVDVRTNQRLNAVKAREKQVAEEKRAADRLSYNSYLQSINPYGANAQNAARLGLANSGFSETSLMNLGTVYQQALAGNEKARAEAMRELSRLCDEAIAEGNREKYDLFAQLYKTAYDMGVKKAEKDADFDLEAARMLENERIRQDENAREDAIRREKYAREDAKKAAAAKSSTKTTTKKKTKTDDEDEDAIFDIGKSIAKSAGKVTKKIIAPDESEEDEGFFEGFWKFLTDLPKYL